MRNFAKDARCTMKNTVKKENGVQPKAKITVMETRKNHAAKNECGPTMGNAALKKHIVTAEKTGVLNVSKSKLDEFPEDISRLKGNLRSLDMSYNRLSILPPSIGDYKSLKSLLLDSNNLTSLPSEIGQLIKLEILSVASNKLQNLPNSLSNCTNLKQVQVSNNSMTMFPEMLCGLKHLDLLDLSGNMITSVPDVSRGLYVTELNMNRNRLDRIAHEITEAPKLKTLRIQENCLTLDAIPKTILSNSKVSTLDVEGNLFDMRQFTHVDGYDQYMERFTAIKKKLS